MVAISLAQKELGSVSLDDCEIFVNAEPCAFCCYAIRESRIRRVVFGLSSPHMGGLSKWNVLADNDLNAAMLLPFSLIFLPYRLCRGGGAYYAGPFP